MIFAVADQLNPPHFQEDHFGVSVGFFIPMQDSLVSLRTQPLRFIIELLKYLIWGTGWLLGPVLQLAIFAHSSMLDDTGKPVQKEKVSEKLPDIEIMPVSCCPDPASFVCSSCPSDGLC